MSNILDCSSWDLTKWGDVQVEQQTQDTVVNT